MASDLIQKSIDGDVASFEELIKEYRTYVYNIAYRMMGNTYDADDMAQEALIKAFKSIHQFKANAKFSTWLYRIVMNTCKDELRKRKDVTVPLEEQLDALADDKEEKYDPLIIYEKKELKGKIQMALNKLSNDGKEVIVLRDIMGYSYDEIGEMLEIPIGTVRSRISRNRIMLKNILQAEV
jgi:RNA polymerase sigma-70 factor (ECF subfamily)